jgi:hypothetical protein
MHGILRVLIGVVLGAASASGTVDHWTTTYHVVPGPEGEGLMLMPIQFLTCSASPETEINAISEPNHLDLRGNSSNQDANLVSLYGIKVRVVDHSATTGTVVQVDLTNLRTPTNLANRVGAPSNEKVVGLTVEGVIAVAKQVAPYGRLEIRIKAPAGDDAAKWQKYARILERKPEEAEPFPQGRKNKISR